MRAPVGAEVRLFYDALDREVQPDDVIQTPTGRSYLVLGIRRQIRGVHIGRWHARCLVIDQAAVPEDAVVHPVTWYRRGRR
jgi:hypothetical protein